MLSFLYIIKNLQEIKTGANMLQLFMIKTRYRKDLIMVNEQEKLSELYDYITDQVNTKYPDISDFDRDDIIQDVYLKAYTTYLAKHQDTPKYKRNAYVINYVKRYADAFLAKRQSIVYLHDYLQEYPECKVYSQKEYADVINKESYDRLLYNTNERRTLPERRYSMTIQHIVDDLTLYDIAKQYLVTQERIRQQIVFTLQKLHQTARDENLPYTDDWLENTDNGHTYESNGFMTTTDFN